LLDFVSFLAFVVCVLTFSVLALFAWRWEGCYCSGNLKSFILSYFYSEWYFYSEITCWPMLHVKCLLKWLFLYTGCMLWPSTGCMCTAGINPVGKVRMVVFMMHHNVV